jgi:hypothetical protein
MKNYIKYLFSIFFGIYFLIAGLGFNVAHYCCQNCADEGIETMTAHACDANHQHKSKSCCDDSTNEFVDFIKLDQPQKCCHLERLHVDISTPVVQSEFANQLLVFSDLFFVNDLLLLRESDSLKLFANLFSPPNFPTNSGREILTLKAVLLI